MEAGVESVVVFPVQADVLESELDEILHAVGLAGGENKVLGGGLLKDTPHCVDEFGGESPIAVGIDVSE